MEAIGSKSVPVFINDNGAAEPCNPIPEVPSYNKESWTFETISGTTVTKQVVIDS